MINLKRSELNSIYTILKDVKLNKIKDSDVRQFVLRIILEGKKDNDALMSDNETIRSKFFDEFPSEDLNVFQDAINKITILVNTGKSAEAHDLDVKTCSDYPELTAAFQNYNTASKELRNEEISLNIEPVTVEKFVDAMIEQELDLTGNIIEELSPIFKYDSEN